MRYKVNLGMSPLIFIKIKIRTVVFLSLYMLIPNENEWGELKNSLNTACF